MGKMIDRFKRQPKLDLDPEIKESLRELAGWPMESHHQSGYRIRHHEVTIHRDANGRTIGSVENAVEGEFDDYHHNWGK